MRPRYQWHASVLLVLALLVGLLGPGLTPATRAAANQGVAAWGRNSFGQLGNGTTTNSSTPAPISGLSGVTAIAGGYYHSLALRDDGTVYAWGWNVFGQLGNGTTTSSNTPMPISGLSGVTAIVAGGAHNLALTSTGAVYAWGYNAYGQLGDGSTIDRYAPVRVSGAGGVGTLSGIVTLAGGYNHSLALTSTGAVYAWGQNDTGQLGDGTTTERHTPGPVSGLSSIVAIAGGADHGLALATSQLSVSPSTVDYGNQQVGTTSASQTVTLANTGAFTITVSGVTLTGANPGDFVIANNGCPPGTVLAPGASCSVSVQFKPTTTGNRTAQLTVSSNAANSPQSVTLTGTSTPPGWAPWVSLGGILTDAPAAAGFNGQVYLFAKGTDNALYASSSADGTNFTPWRDLGGILTAAPAATSTAWRECVLG